MKQEIKEVPSWAKCYGKDKIERNAKGTCKPGIEYLRQWEILSRPGWSKALLLKSVGKPDVIETWQANIPGYELTVTKQRNLYRASRILKAEGLAAWRKEAAKVETRRASWLIRKADREYAKLIDSAEVAMARAKALM